MDGDVDDRPIEEVQAVDLEGYVRCHFFSGIAGWDYALQLAGWDESRPIWTGSCPCQPFSAAGKRKGVNDERHVWPAFHRLIAECRPDVCFGEQVDGPDGRKWLSGVRTDMEADGYRFGFAGLPAASVGAPHKRARLWWVADTDRPRIQSDKRVREQHVYSDEGMADTDEPRPQGRGQHAGEHASQRLAGQTGAVGGMGDAESQRRRISNTENDGPHPGSFNAFAGAAKYVAPTEESGALNPAFVCWLHGVSGRVGRLRGYGNAIVPQVAAVFIRAYMESRPK